MKISGNSKNRKNLMQSSFLPIRYLASRNITKNDMQILMTAVKPNIDLSTNDFTSFIKHIDLFEKLTCSLNDNLITSHETIRKQAASQECILWMAYYLGHQTENIHLIDPSVLEAMKHTDLGNITFEQLPAIEKPLYLQVNETVILVFFVNNELTFFGIPDTYCRKPYESTDLNVEIMTNDTLQWVALDASVPTESIESKLIEFQKSIEDIYSNNSNLHTHHLSDFKEDMDMSDEEHDKLLRDLIDKSKQANSEFLSTAIKCLLFYLATNDLEIDWSPDVPKKEIEQIKNIKNPARKQTQEKALIEHGHFKVTYIGRQYANSIEAKNLANYITHEQANRTVSPHFRRGHFRSQRYGKEFALKKIIFIAPTFVNPDA